MSTKDLPGPPDGYPQSGQNLPDYRTTDHPLHLKSKQHLFPDCYLLYDDFKKHVTAHQLSHSSKPFTTITCPLNSYPRPSISTLTQLSYISITAQPMDHTFNTESIVTLSLEHIPQHRTLSCLVQNPVRPPFSIHFFIDDIHRARKDASESVFFFTCVIDGPKRCAERN